MARPKGKRRGRYRMTPARRAALRKAQAASARKRRRKAIGSAVGKTAVNIGGLFLAARASSYIIKPSNIGKDYNSVKSFSQAVNRKFFQKNSTPQTLRNLQNGPWV